METACKEHDLEKFGSISQTSASFDCHVIKGKVSLVSKLHVGKPIRIITPLNTRHCATGVFILEHVWVLFMRILLMITKLTKKLFFLSCKLKFQIYIAYIAQYILTCFCFREKSQLFSLEFDTRISVECSEFSYHMTF